MATTRPASQYSRSRPTMPPTRLSTSQVSGQLMAPLRRAAPPATHQARCIVSSRTGKPNAVNSYRQDTDLQVQQWQTCAHAVDI